MRRQSNILQKQPNEVPLTKRVAVVTGRAQGIGRAICETLARDGATVVVAELNLDGPKAVARALNAQVGRAVAAQVDGVRGGTPMNATALNTTSPIVFIATTCLWVMACLLAARGESTVIVAADGSGQFGTVQAAVDSIPADNQQRIIIIIKNGDYADQVRVNKSFLTLRGQDRKKTRLCAAVDSDRRSAEHKWDAPDWDPAHLHPSWATLEVDAANDVTLENLTITNPFRARGYAAALFSNHGATRLSVVNCDLTSAGGDTVSTWSRGLHYFRNCQLAGTYHFFGPRGTCYVTNCQFWCLGSPISLFNEGISDETDKLVIRNSTFDGPAEFGLGSYFRDAAWYFIDCQFSNKLKANGHIFRKASQNYVLKWGERRVYFAGCQGPAYPWLADNISSSPAKTKETATAQWTLRGWNPETLLSSDSMETAAPIPTNIVGKGSESDGVFRNGDYQDLVPRLDSDGNHIAAHSGGIIFMNGKYWWYGQTLQEEPQWKHGGATRIGVVMYSSPNLLAWKYEGVILPCQPSEDLDGPLRFERPKIIYNEKTGKFVMWCHYVARPGDHGVKAGTADAGVASCNTINGIYQWHGYHRPLRPDMTVKDCTLFKDKDATAYFIFDSYPADRSKERCIHIARLSDDYLKEVEVREIPGTERREAPAMFKKDGYYFLITSGVSGWDPNAAKCHRATNIWGPYEELGNFCVGEQRDITFNAQSAYVFELHDAPGCFVFMGDRWRQSNMKQSTHIWLPLEFPTKNTVRMRYFKQWDWRAYPHPDQGADPRANSTHGGSRAPIDGGVVGTVRGFAPAAEARPGAADGMTPGEFAGRIAPVAKGTGFAMDGYFVWCGSVIKVGGAYHLFASRWPVETTFPDGYRQNSEIVRAVAAQPEGPYSFQEIVIGKRAAGKWDSAMASNPAIYKVGDTFMLYYIGSEVGSRYRQIGIATAPAVTGPWTRRDKPLDLGLAADANNPAACFEPDGSVRLIWRTVGLRVFVSVAASFAGPYTLASSNVWPTAPLEDFFVFKHAGCYHMICEDNAGSVTGHKRWGAHLTSPDGVAHWRPWPQPTAYDRTIRWTDGTEFKPVRRERPWLLIEDGRITHLFTAVYDGKRTWNQPVPLVPAVELMPSQAMPRKQPSQP